MSAQLQCSGSERRGANINTSYRANAIGREWTQWKPSVFDFKRYTRSQRAVCPTCQGTGKIPKDHEDELVALIPYKDKRLKPQRKCLFLFISLLLLLVLVLLATTLMVIFFPRHVDVTILGVNSTELLDLSDNSTNFILEMAIALSLRNNNFFSVYLSKFQISLVSMDTEVGVVTLQPFSLSPRTLTPDTVLQNATFKDGMARLVQVICTNKNWNSHHVYMELNIEVTYIYLSQLYDSFVTNGSYVECGPTS